MTFKNVKKYAFDGISNLLEMNLKSWLEDSFMRIGTIIPQRTSVLQPNTVAGTVNLKVWDSKIQSWAPRRLEGNDIIVTPATVKVNGVTETDVTINYSKGQVTFTDELLPSDKVEARYYSNKVGIYNVSELNCRPMIRLESQISAENNEDYTTFQELSVSKDIRTPHIILETFPTGSANPIMLGSGAVWAMPVS